MTHHRTQLRIRAMDVLGKARRFRNFTAIKAWSQSVDSESLPVYCVTVARETSEAVDTNSHERRVDLQFIAKRIGGDDIEDQLDLDAEAAEVALLPYLRATYLHAALMQTDIEISGEGRGRIGMLQLAFTVMLHTDMPA